MNDFDRRTERDRGLFEEDLRKQVAKTLSATNPDIIAGVVRKSLEWQISMEEYARSKGVDFDGEEFLKYRQDNRMELERDLDRALISFIGAIVSQEG